VGNPNTLGLDAAIAAGFIALLWPQINSKFTLLVAVISAVVAIVAIPLVQPGIPILLAGFVAAILAWVKAMKNND
jgi:predicted branched-subunit amino acid permease